MKPTLIVALVSALILGGCASTREPIPEPTPVASSTPVKFVLEHTVEACITKMIDAGNAHVLDATQACSHIYGLKAARIPRTTSLD